MKGIGMTYWATQIVAQQMKAVSPHFPEAHGMEKITMDSG
jgi:hypothetical protein